MALSRGKGRRIVAEDEINVAPEATDLLFEAEDVAELVTEITGQPVEVTADGDAVTFAVGEGEAIDEYTVTAEGDEEILESSRRMLRGKRQVSASRRPMARRPVSASRRPMARRPVSASTARPATRRPVARPVVASRKPVERTATPVRASKSIRRTSLTRRTSK